MLHCASMANVVRPLAFDAGVLPDWATAVGVAQIHGCACEPSSTGPPSGWLVMVSVTSLPSSLPLPLPLSSATRELRPTTSPVTSPRSVRAAALAVKDEVMSCPFSFTLTLESETCFGTRTSTSASPPLMRSARFDSVTISRFEPPSFAHAAAAKRPDRSTTSSACMLRLLPWSGKRLPSLTLLFGARRSIEDALGLMCVRHECTADEGNRIAARTLEEGTPRCRPAPLAPRAPCCCCLPTLRRAYLARHPID